MSLNDRMKISYPHLSPDSSDGKSLPEIDAVTQLDPFGEESSEVLRDEFLAPEMLEMERYFSPLKSQLFTDRLVAYEVAVWFCGNPQQALTD